jgi:diacylglycerol kinase
MTPEPSAPPPKPPRRWSDKFRDALRGWKFGIRGQSSFAVHFLVAILVVLAAALLRCGAMEWCLLLGCIGLVLTAELFNSCVEMLFRELPAEVRDRAWPCLDVAAGAVLIASVTAAVIGLIVFIPRLAERLGWV